MVLIAATPPMVTTESRALNPVPAMVTEVPPATAPVAGVIEVMEPTALAGGADNTMKPRLALRTATIKRREILETAFNPPEVLWSSMVEHPFDIIRSENNVKDRCKAHFGHSMNGSSLYWSIKSRTPHI